MTRLSRTIRIVLAIGAVCMILGGAVAIIIAAATLVSGRQEPQLIVSQGNEVAIPEAGLFGGSVMVYTGSPAGGNPHQLGCDLIEEDGDRAQLTRMSSFDHALKDPIAFDGTTWYPFTEVDLQSSPATLQCPGEGLSTAGVSQPSLFGGAANLVTWSAFSSGLISICVGTLALIVLRRTTR